MDQSMLATIILGGMGGFFGLSLAYASKKFHVERNPKELAVLDILPGANCGACGYPGCSGYAKAVSNGEDITKCSVGGDKVKDKISIIMGVEAKKTDRIVAKVRCKGGCFALDDFNYQGVKSCAFETLVSNGSKKCKFGCLGGGDCVRACPFNAIVINEYNVANVLKDKCVACGKCIEACPKNLITLVKAKQKTIVECMNKERGGFVKKNCENACIACKMCERTCKFDSIKVIDNLAIIDYEKCVDCTACARKCPTGAISLIEKVKKVAV